MFSKYVKRVRSVRSGSGHNDVPQLREDLEYLRWLVTQIRHRPSTTNFKRRTTKEVVQAMMMSEITDNESGEEESQIQVVNIEDGSMDQKKKIQDESAIEITSAEVDQAWPIYSPSGLDDEISSVSTSQSLAPILELAPPFPNSLSLSYSASPTPSVISVAKKNVTKRKILPSVTPKSKKSLMTLNGIKMHRLNTTSSLVGMVICQ